MPLCLITQSKVTEVSLCACTWRLRLLSWTSKKKVREGKRLGKDKKRLITLARRQGVCGCGQVERREDFG